MNMNDHQLIKETFNTEVNTLPLLEEVSQYVQFNSFDIFTLKSLNLIEQYNFRHNYIRNSFPLLMHEWISTLANFLTMPTIELCAGGGWLGYWLKKYGANIIQITDDYSWNNESQQEFNIIFQEWVENLDSVYVTQQHKASCYILSWPYMDDTAVNVWDAMEPGEYLFYIGEGYGGCTANERFFDAVNNKEVRIPEDIIKYYKSFFGIHDYPQLFRK